MRRHFVLVCLGRRDGWMDVHGDLPHASWLVPVIPWQKLASGVAVRGCVANCTLQAEATALFRQKSCVVNYSETMVSDLDLYVQIFHHWS